MFDTTNMSEFGDQYNGRHAEASREIPMEQWGFLDAAEKPEALKCLYGHEDGLSPEAWLVAARLAGSALPYSGEAIVQLSKIAEACALDEDRVLWALDEMASRGVIVFWRLATGESGRHHIHCEFDIEEPDAFYGDDENPPCDNIEALEGDAYERLYDPDEYEESADDDEVPFNDPNPKRHRVFLKTSYRCFYCIDAWAEQIDHMHPRIRGGGNEDSNLIGACQPCNVRKKDRTVEEYRAYLAHKHRLPDISHVRFWGEAVN